MEVDLTKIKFEESKEGDKCLVCEEQAAYCVTYEGKKSDPAVTCCNVPAHKEYALKVVMAAIPVFKEESATV